VTDDRAAFSYRGDPDDRGAVGVLLVHGFTGSPQSLRGWADHLVEAGHSVELPLLPGHGTSWQDANRTTFDDWLAAAAGALADLRQSCRAVVVAGLSMGGTLTLRLAELHPEAMAGIVLVNPSVLTKRKDAPFSAVIKYVMPSFPPIANDIAKPGVEEIGYDRLPVRAFDTLRRAWTVVRRDLPKVTAPTRLLHSRVDHVVEPVNSEVILGAISATDVTEVVLEKSYHVATLDYDAELIYAESVRFIERVTAG
jgi:carboxylesterase